MTKKHSKHAPPTTTEVLRTRVERAVAEDRFQQALELSKQLVRQDPVPLHQELLRKATFGRARQLRAQGHTRDAAVILEHALTLSNDPAWLGEVAAELAGCGQAQKALNILAKLPGSAAQGRIYTLAVDAALEQGKSGRDALPEALRGQYDLVVSAFAHVEAGQDDAAREALQGIGLASPFLEWKLFLRGLQAYYRREDPRAIENWQRLDPARTPARLAAPLRYLIDPAYRQAQPPETQALLQKQADRLQGDGLVVPLRAIQKALANTEQLPQAFRLVEGVLSALKQQAPQLVSRLAACYFWAIVTGGEPEDVGRFKRVFGAPADDPHHDRLQAMLAEQLGDMDRAHKHWQQFDKAIAGHAALWPGEQGTRARALVWAHMGKNAANVPDLDKLPDIPFLRDMPSKPKKLKPTAEECFARAQELAPDQVESYEALFQYCLDQIKLDTASAMVEERTAPTKRAKNAAEKRALAASKARRQAIAAGRRLLEKFPDHVATLSDLGDLLMETGAYAEAQELFRRALRTNPLDRRLRARLADAHLYHARTQAEADRFDEARAEYQAALALNEGRSDYSILCKWAACEFKAGDVAKAEELLARALDDPAGRLAIAFSMVIEMIRLKLSKLKKRFNDEFNAALTETPAAASAVAVLDTTASHRMANVTYFGQKTHEKKVLAYAERALAADFSEEQLDRACFALVTLEADKLLRQYAFAGRRRFPESPFFYFWEAESYISLGPYRCPAWRVGPLLDKARALAEKLPPDDRKDALLDTIQARQEMLGVQGIFGGRFGPGGMFGNVFEDLFGRNDDDGEDD